MSNKLELIVKHLNPLRDMEDVHYVNIRRKHSDIPTKLKDIIYNTSQTLHILKNISRGGLTGSLAGIIAYNFNDISLRDSTLFRRRISGRVNKKIDIQVYNHLPAKIKKEIKLKGKVLYKNEN